MRTPLLSLLTTFVVFFQISVIAQPTITSFTPASGPIGTSVTITGTNFSTTAANNTVYFGAVKATVTLASATSLTVTVPAGATYHPITVMTAGLTAYSRLPFIVTFAGGGFINSNSFDSKLDFTVGSGPSDIAICDIDGDGKPDLAVANANVGTGTSFSVLRNTSTSTNISFASKADFTTLAGPYTITTGDIDGDGKADVVVIEGSNPASVSTFLNTSTSGNISFATRQDFSIGNYSDKALLQDIDMDGKSDLIIHTLNAVSIMRNTSTIGNISFAAAVNYFTSIQVVGAAVSDIDGDNKPDMVLTNYGPSPFNTPQVSVFRNTSTSGSISFVATGVDFSTSSNASTTGLLISDTDADGKPDIGVLNDTDKQISYFRNTSTTGSVSMASKFDVATSSYPGSLATADIDGDGKPDFAIDDGNPNHISLRRNTTSGTTLSFASALYPDNSLTTSGVFIGDVDSDGRPEIISISSLASNTNVSVYKNIMIPPAISSFSPASAGPGITVTITGTNLTGSTAVSFGGTAASSFNVVSSTSITAVVASGTSGSVSVTTPAGTATKTGFTFVPAPTVSSFTPTSGAGGATITITGTNLSGATAVSFGGTAASSFTVVSSTSITAVVASGTSGTVSVTTPGGTATKSGFTFIPAPTVSSFTPTSASLGTVVTITGTNFSGATAVSFGGTAASSFTVASSTSITAVVAAGTSGTVSVTAPGGTGTKTGFTYIPIQISSFTPTSAGSGTTVTITGTSFTGATAVSFGGTAASSFTVVSSTSITAVVASGTSGSVSVTAPGGTVTKTGFTFISPPTISSFSPTSAVGGTTITITGTNLSGATAVSFGGTAATSFTVVSSTSITAVVGSGSSGSVSVTTPGGTATKTGFTFIFTPAPTITSFTPTSRVSGTTVTITGTNLSGATAVKFGGTAASSFTIVSSTSISAVVGSGTSGSVSVTTPGGTATMAGFTFVSSPVYWSGAIATSLAGRSDGVALVINGKSYVGLGKNGTGLLKDWWEFNPSNNVWTQKLDFPGTARIGAVAFVINGKGYVGTGNDQSGNGFKQDIYEYDAAANTWTAKADFPADFNSDAGITAGVSFSIGNFGYVGLGNTGLNNTKAFYKFDPIANSWQSIADFPGNGRTGAAGFAADGFGYAGLGFGSLSPNRQDMWQYDPTTNQWTAKSSWSGAGRGGAAVAVVNGEAFIFAGTENTSGTFGADTRTNAVVSYSALINQWTSQTAIPASVRTGAMAFSINNIAYVFGGYNYSSGNVYLSDMYSFKPPSTFLPADPTAAIASVQSQTQIQCTWVDNSSNETGFIVEYAVANSATYSLAATLPANTTTYTHSGLTADTQYQYRISAVNAYGDSQPATTEVVVTTLPPTAPSNLSANVLSSSSISLLWTDNSSNETKFEIYRSTSNNSSYALVFTLAANSNTYTDTGLSPVTTYFYKVKAVNNGGSSFSNEVSKATLPNAPTITSFTPGSAGTDVTVTITGTNFDGATAVSFGGVAASAFTVVSSTTITATVAGGASGNVSVTTPGGVASLGGFAYISPPIITLYTPSSAGTGETVTITGAEFTGATAVSFGGTAASSFTVVSSTSITAVVGGGATGSISVTTPGGTASVTGFTFNPAVTGIEKNVAGFDVEVFPNPTSGFEINLTFDQDWENKFATIAIVDISGRVVQTSFITCKSVTRLPIDNGKLTSGLYILTLQSGKKNARKKLQVLD